MVTSLRTVAKVTTTIAKIAATTAKISATTAKVTSAKVTSATVATAAAAMDSGSILNHPILIGLIVSVSTVLGGFILYKFIPWIYDIIKESHDLRFYHSIVIPLDQNKVGVINALKFLSGKDMTETTGLRTRIAVEGLFYNIPINKHIHFEDSSSGTEYGYRAKINVDQKGNVANVVFSTPKRKASGFLDEKRILAFDKFVDNLSPASLSVVVHSATASSTSTIVTAVHKPTIPSGTSAQMQNVAAATTVGVVTDFN